jgi:hypothetical protein
MQSKENVVTIPLVPAFQSSVDGTAYSAICCMAVMSSRSQFHIYGTLKYEILNIRSTDSQPLRCRPGRSKELVQLSDYSKSFM